MCVLRALQTPWLQFQAHIPPQNGSGGKDHLVQHPCSIGAIPELVAGAHRRCQGVNVEPRRARTASSMSSAFPTWGHKARADTLGRLPVSLGDSLAVGQRAQVLPRRAGSSVPSCELPGPGQHRV